MEKNVTIELTKANVKYAKTIAELNINAAQSGINKAKSYIKGAEKDIEKAEGNRIISIILAMVCIVVMATLVIARKEMGDCVFYISNMVYTCIAGYCLYLCYKNTVKINTLKGCVSALKAGTSKLQDYIIASIDCRNELECMC